MKNKKTNQGKEELSCLDDQPGRRLRQDLIKQPSYGTQKQPHSSGDLEAQVGANVSIGDVIGNFGWFQFVVLLFSGLREGAVGYDAVIMSIVLRPEYNFLCADQLVAELHPTPAASKGSHRVAHLWGGSPKRSEEPPVNISEQMRECYITSDGNKMTTQCETWLFPQSDRDKSLVADWSLVCQRAWLVAFIESAYFFGLVVGNLSWGYLADRIGRRTAYLCSHSLALIGGLASIFAPTIELFAIFRCLSAFGSIGYNIIYSIQVELIGTKYRAFSTTLNHLGWGLGVICVPLADRMFSSHYRYLIAVAPFLALITFPWAFWLPESSRWLMTRGRYKDAREQLIRAARFNGKTVDRYLEKNLRLLEQKATEEMLSSSKKHDTTRCSNPYRILLSSPVLIKDTLILSLSCLTGHLFYYLLTINFAYIKSLSVEANFISSGAGEWVSVLLGAALLKIFTRKTCMSIYISLIGVQFTFQAIIDAKLAPALDNPTFVTINNGIGTVSALLLIFVVLIVNQEVYPTVIRQTGSSIVNTLGESGSMMAPVAIHLSRILGFWQADILYLTCCVIALIATQFITKTDDIELLDA